MQTKTIYCECNVCGQLYENWSGSTPCCGSVAFVVTEKDFRKEKIRIIKNNIKNKKNEDLHSMV